MLIIIFSFLLLLYIYKENYFLEKTVSESNKDVLLSLSSSDLVKPKFSIKGKKDSISVSANHGNFITKDKILLKNKEVVFTDGILLDFWDNLKEVQ